MRIISEIIGNAKGKDLSDKKVVHFDLEWFETTRKVLRKTGSDGQEIALRILKENFRIKHNDIFFEDDNEIIVANVLPADAVVLQPQTMLEMGTVCYEIGNQHIPIFIEDNEVIIPYEDPIFNLLNKSGYKPIKGKRIFENMLKATPEHTLTNDTLIDMDSLFSKVLSNKN
ncbi:urease accessory protein UreE [Oceanihabitans sp. IOP_32]|uniref:urease accessory protein UreE n=1 Tax=Oceanihabitans sp. IOP_32 TaxID=2529032 RepID=UPI001292F6D4|nr:urease accessory protein UreE [Oceanihabitans sp. IOP_32]QFZ55307.1 urease accessory protein UreE [Oceanihabitans sp. IOP_32]